MLSAIVITYNEEQNIGACLESLGWCDELIVVDSYSSDRTTEIARGYNSIVKSVKDLPYGEKRNTGIDMASGEWILWIDADERITPELQREITELVSADKQPYEAYLINRKSFFINKFIKHCGWYPDYTLRLFKRSSGIRFNSLLVHESAVYGGQKGKLKNDLLHYTDMDFEHYLKKLNHYTTLSAEELFKKGKKAGFIDIIFRPAFTFFKMYFLKLGILDGFMGLVLCTLSSIHVSVKYSKLYLKNRNNQ